LTSLATAEWPGQHGVTGWWTHLPEIRGAGVLLQFVDRYGSRSLTAMGLSVEQAFPAPAVMRSIERDTLALFPEQLGDSASSRYFSGGRPLHSYRIFADAADAILDRINSAQGPTYTYLYTPRIDHEGHQYGITRPEVGQALEEIQTQLARLSRGLGSRA